MGRRVPELIDFGKERIRTLHFTWVAFFITFYLWFNMAPLATTMLRDLGGEDGWLTLAHIQFLAICNVALTIPARIIIGALIDRFGPRRCFSGLLIVMSIPTFMFAFGTTFMQLMIARLLLSCIGAGFVIGIRMVAQWFPPKMVGRAEGFYAGWGNFGSAWAAMTLPWIALELFGAYEDGWRYALAINGVVSLVYGVIYFFIVRDTPKGTEFVGRKKAEPLLVSSWGDLVQYCLFSVPLIATLGLLAWRAHDTMISGEPIISDKVFYIILGILGLVLIAHIAKTLQVNVPRLKKGVPEEARYKFNSVAALNVTYIANFGAELAVVSMLPAFFERTFSISPVLAGMVAASFAFVNLIARPLGGLISDTMHNRRLVMILYMTGISLGFFGMAFIDGTWPLWVAIVLVIMCSIFVQGAEGATFAIIPLINRPMTGQIAGMAGAYGNVGAVIYLVIYSVVGDGRIAFLFGEAHIFFLILAGGAAFSVLYCLVFLEEPKGGFAEDYGEVAGLDEEEEKRKARGVEGGPAYVPKETSDGKRM